MKTSIAVHEPNAIQSFEPTNFNEAYKLFGALIKSNMLPPDIRAPEQALFIFLAGRQIGLNMMQSFVNIHFIRGRIVVGATVIAAQIMNSPLCEDWKIIESTDSRATIETKRRGRDVERVSFTIDEARQLGLANRDQYQKQPANMLYHRCVTKLGRRVYPEIVTGVYTPDESEDFKQAPTTQPVEAGDLGMTITSTPPPANAKPVPQPETKAEVELKTSAPQVEMEQMKKTETKTEPAPQLAVPEPEPEPQPAAEPPAEKTEYQVWRDVMNDAAVRYGKEPILALHAALGLPDTMKSGWTAEKRALSKLAFELLDGKPMPAPLAPFVAIVRTEANQKGIES